MKAAVPIIRGIIILAIVYYYSVESGDKVPTKPIPVKTSILLPEINTSS